MHGGRNMGLISDHSININPLGMPGESRKAVLDSLPFLSAYPEIDCERLIRRLSEKYMGNGVILGNGSAELIYALCHHISYQDPGFTALMTAPTFTEYENAVRAAGGKTEIIASGYDDDYLITPDIVNTMEETIKNKNIRLVFICNPNNPTGQLLERDILKCIAKCCLNRHAILAVDECFLHFCGEYDKYSVLPIISEYGNILILDSFTKVYAMAGLRIGYAISSNKNLLGEIRKQIQPWNISKPAYEAAIAALDLTDQKEKTVKYINEERDYLIKGLCDIGIRVIGKPAADYVFFKEEAKLEKKGIGIRECSDMMKPTKAEDCFYRAAVLTHVVNEKLLKALKEIKDK